ncbi:MAG: hypothetical protein AB8F74_06200 [Saprospiraceae bacterium]
MTFDVYDEWYSIDKEQISNNGRWIIYEQSREKLDGVLKVYDTKKEQQVGFLRTNRGFYR